MADFKKGELVKLKSGGPTMTVKDVGKYDLIDDGVLCEWYDVKDNKYQERIFDIEVLVSVK